MNISSISDQFLYQLFSGYLFFQISKLLLWETATHYYCSKIRCTGSRWKILPVLAVCIYKIFIWRHHFPGTSNFWTIVDSVKIRYSAMAKTRCYLAGLVKYFGSFTCDNHQRWNKVMWIIKLQDVINSFAFPDKT